MSQPGKYQFNIRLILIGFFIALLSTGIGIGGGSLLVPIFMSVFGFDFKKAAGTSLATIIPISFIGSISHFIFLPENPHLQYYFTFIPACVLGSILGGRVVQRRQNGWLKLAFSLFLLIASLKILKIFDFPSLIYSGLHNSLLSNELLLIIPIGILIGILAVLLGIGCGLLIVPFYVIVINLDIHETITLSLTTMFFLSISATIVHKKLNSLDITLLKKLFIPALTGAVIGAIISSHLPTPILKKIFGVFLFIIVGNNIIHGLYMHHKLTVSVRNCMEGIRRAL